VGLRWVVGPKSSARTPPQGPAGRPEHFADGFLPRHLSSAPSRGAAARPAIPLGQRAAGPGRAARPLGRRRGSSGQVLRAPGRKPAARNRACVPSRPRVPPVWPGGWPAGRRRLVARGVGPWSCVGVGRSVGRGGGFGRGGRFGVWRVVGRGVGCGSGLVASGVVRGRWFRVGVVARWSGGRRVGSSRPGVGGGVGCVRGLCRSCRRGSCRAGRWRPVRVRGWRCSGRGFRSGRVGLRPREAC